MPRIAGYDLFALETGRFALDGGAMFGIVPRVLWEKKIAPDARHRIPLAMRCLLLVGHGRVVLVDAGIGRKYDDRFRDIFAIDHGQATLEGSLGRAGFSTEDVTDLVLTHLHFDHCGGATRREGDRVLPTFPRARTWVQRAHWAWASDSNPKEQASFLEENLQPLERSELLACIEGDAHDLPHVELLVVDGHTRAQQLLKVSDEARTLVYAADLIPTTAHLNPVWNMAYDVFPLTSIGEKEQLLRQAARHGWTLMFEHDPAVEIAGVELAENRFRATAPRPLSDL